VKEIYDYKHVIFDCDGVILQSNKIKTKAFEETLKEESPENISKFITYHKNNGGISRFIKFEYFYKKIKKEKNYSKMAEMAIRCYAEIIQNKLINAKYVPGFIGIIKYLNKNKIPCYIISGGEQKELKHIFKMRGIYNCFNKILGSPTSKNNHLKNLISSNEINNSTILFGDSFLDMQAALNNMIDFCYVYQFSEWKDGKIISKKLGFSKIKNFNEIL